MYKKRFLEKKVWEAAQFFKVVLILGARQVGKSTLLKELFPERESFVFDSILDPYQIKSDPDLFLDLHPAPLVLDEVQFAPTLLSAIKRRVDRSDIKGQYYLTGSQNLNVLKNVSETMPGRVGILHMEGMSLHERMQLSLEENWLVRYLKNPESFIAAKQSCIEGMPNLTEILFKGSLPQAIEGRIEDLPLFFNSYIQAYVERDLRLVERIENLQQFGEFLFLLGALSGQEINYSQLGREIGITHQTAKRWLFALGTSYQWREVLPFHRNEIKKLSEKRKGYLTDSGIASHLLRIRTPLDLAAHPSLGALFETWVVNHLFQLLSLCNLQPAFYHWRAYSGAEIDLILEINNTLFPIEIKCSRNLSRHDLKPFASFREMFSARKIAPSLIIHAGDENYPLDRTTFALSWKAL